MTFRTVIIPQREKEKVLGFIALRQLSHCNDKTCLLFRGSVLLIAFQHNAKAKWDGLFGCELSLIRSLMWLVTDYNDSLRG